jgi:hypothetical protein
MAGTITTSVIQNDTSSPPTFRNNSVEIGTLCRAWVNFNGTGTVAIRSSFNVSSITDNGSGDYTINFTTAMPDANYATIGSASTGASDFRSVVPAFGAGWVYSTTQVRIGSAFQTGLSDCANIYVAVFR